MEEVFSLFVLIGFKILSVSLVIRSSTKDLAPFCPMMYAVIRWSLVSFDATQPDEILMGSSPLYSNGLPWAEWLQLDFVNPIHHVLYLPCVNIFIPFPLDLYQP